MNATSRDNLSSLATHTSQLLALGLLQRRLQLRAPVERISALARLDLGVLGDDVEPFGLGERGDGAALRLQAQPERPCFWVTTR